MFAVFNLFYQNQKQIITCIRVNAFYRYFKDLQCFIKAENKKKKTWRVKLSQSD